MEFENLNIWCWLIPALVGIVSGIFGYLIGKGGHISVTDHKELKLAQDHNAKLKADLENCQKKLSAGAAVPAGTITASAAIKTEPFNAKSATAALGKTVKLDDLTIVEGIGPKIQQLFHAAGIKTWKALSETSVATCQQILTDAGNRFKVHQPGSWPMQAKMAHEGKWRDLAKWQDQHKHGKL
jgi:predicted flap endonuclease-1-like 5' DNA nuclease